mmetsp:Transcript_27732/g.63545  ORF Transcript_27732/g.63545 Transcript_27732/m.63545 type:complete len:194 (-) Transcript_27732:261-842(-)
MMLYKTSNKRNKKIFPINRLFSCFQFTFTVSLCFSNNSFPKGEIESHYVASTDNDYGGTLKKYLRKNNNEVVPKNNEIQPFSKKKNTFLNSDHHHFRKKMRMTLCTNSCKVDEDNNDCMVYETTSSECYNGSNIFPDDKSWGPYDIIDTVFLGELVSNAIVSFERFKILLLKNCMLEFQYFAKTRILTWLYWL